jgi:hypothetical protein
MEVRSISPSLLLLPEQIVKMCPLRSLQASTSDALQGTVSNVVLTCPPGPFQPCMLLLPRPLGPTVAS